jgi:membrane-associated phospholipid phosphatase
MNFIINIDQQVFYFINNTCHFEALDKVMPYWRSMYLWIPLYIFFTTFLIEKFGKKGWIYLLCLAITIGCSDTISSKYIKKSVERARPCQDISRNLEYMHEVKLLIPCGSGYSFPSSHATNHFAIALFIILTFARRKKWLKRSLIIWASTIALGQVYVGVHYPLDVICGGILGSLIGWAAAYFYNKYAKEFNINTLPIA